MCTLPAWHKEKRAGENCRFARRTHLKRHKAARAAADCHFETPLPAALYSSLKSVRPRTGKSSHTGMQIGRPLLHFPLLLAVYPWEGFPKGNAPMRRRGRIKQPAFEEMARLAAHQGRASYRRDGVRWRPHVSGGGSTGEADSAPRHPSPCHRSTAHCSLR